MKNFIPFALPDIGKNDIKEVVAALRSDWITTGPRTKAFEDKFARYVGVRHAIALNSATAGLHLSLECIGLSPNDMVITTPYTFAATAEVIRYFNADPVFVDICSDDYNIDPGKIEKFCRTECRHKRDGVLYHKKTGSAVKAIMPVHIGGYPCDMDAILSIADRYNLKVIEDAAHALPSLYKGRMVGTMSDLTVFSFYATKPITTAEGGMVVTDNPEYQRRIRVMRLHGIDRDIWDRHAGNRPNWYYEIIEPGYKYNMTDVAAALGLRQLEKVNKFYEKRRKIACRYNKKLIDHGCIELPRYRSDRANSWHLYMVRLKSKRVSRNKLIDTMYKMGVGVGVHYIPLHIHPYYRKRYGYKPADYPVSYECYKRSVSLPIYSRLTWAQIDRIINTLGDILS